jgi:mannose-6-phosphate isomerase-like protein (cupin superfamily)
MPLGAYVVSAQDGEHLYRSAAQAAPGAGTIPSGGSVCIKVDPRTGSTGLSLGTQHLPTGIGVRVHRHFKADEVLFVLDGTGMVLLDDQRTPIAKGSAIYIPKGVWHGIENPAGPLDLLWVVTPPGLEQLFREIGSPLGAPPKQFSLEQLNDIAQKHEQQFRP